MKTRCPNQGHVLILVLLLLPLLAVFVVLVADVASHVVAKLSLQVAADRAAYTGAERLSAMMNEIAGKNWAIRQQFLAVEREMTQIAMRQTRQEGVQRIREAQQTIDDLREVMDAAVDTGYREACEAARAEAARWVPDARLVPLYGHVAVEGDHADARCIGGDPLFSFRNVDGEIDMVEEDQWPAIEFHWPEGGEGFPDPAEQKQDREKLLQYRVNAPLPSGEPVKVAFAVRLDRPVRRGVLSDAVREQAIFHAAAAAQPYGGSIKETAFVEAASEEEARGAMRYRPTLVPLMELRRGDRGYRGLEYWDNAWGEWKEDDTIYLH